MEASAKTASDGNGKRTMILVAVSIVLLAAAGYLILRPNEEGPPAVVQEKGFYYTGPMKSKTAGSNVYGTIDGRKLTEEEAKAEEKKWLEEHPQVKDAGRN